MITSNVLMAAVLSATLAMPVNAAPVVSSQFLGVEGPGHVVAIAAKRKKKKQVRRNPKNGDILIGKVPMSSKRDWSGARRVREGDDLGGLIGQAVNNFLFGGLPAGGGSRGGGNGRRGIPPGGYGQNCGPQYDTRNPTSPAC